MSDTPAPMTDDVEKGGLQPKRDDDAETRGTGEPQIKAVSRLAAYTRKFEDRLAVYNLEARGIQRVEPDERDAKGTYGNLQIVLLWFSINLAANNITLGLLGPAVYYLSFFDAAMCAVFGSILGCVPVAYLAQWGPKSGNRTMIFARYTMGWWPSRLVVVLNIIVLLGYSLIDCVVAGQMLSAVSPNDSMSVVVGIIIVAVITWVVTTFGLDWFYKYERYAWLPQALAFCILAGCAGPKFNTITPTEGDPLTNTGDRLSFFSLCLAAAITYAGCAADFFVYYPETTSPWRVSLMSMIGLTLSFSFALLLGIGLGSGMATNPSWAAAYTRSQGALIVQGFEGLGAFGRFCAVVIALGLVANIIPPTYSSGVDFQVLGPALARVPRVVWNTVGVLIYTVCALAGRNSLAVIFTNFLALMGYWVAIWVAITLEEHLVFRRTRGWDWTAWKSPGRLPVGVAALVAFLVGWVGAILCMAQVWYIGPIAARVGEYGGDMGNYIGFAWAALVYPPLRYLELKKFGR